MLLKDAIKKTIYDIEMEAGYDKQLDNRQFYQLIIKIR